MLLAASHRSGTAGARWLARTRSFRGATALAAHVTATAPAWSSAAWLQLPTGLRGIAASAKALGAVGPAGGSPAPAADVYERKSALEHVLLRPGMYIGSTAESRETLWVFDEQSKSMKLETVQYNPGLVKVFDEILVNAVDNAVRDASQTRIDVTIDSAADGAPTLSVFNDGRGIPIRKHATEDCYIPELVMGHLLTGSNFDDAKAQVTGGRHGYGAKLANIFSSSFTVETVDAVSRQRYRQTWTKNMTSCGAPSIEAVAGDAVSSSTKVTFQPDMSRFGMGALDAGTLAVMRRRVLDVAGTTRGGLVVTLNGETVGVSDFPGYMALFPAQDCGSAAGAAAPAVAYLAPNKRWEIGVTLSPDATFQSVSFVNGVSTHRGGSHVNAVADLLVKKLLPIVVKKTGGVGTVTPALIKSHMRLFVNCQVPNPTFDSQSKDTLATKAAELGISFSIPDRFVRDIADSVGVADAVAETLLLKDKLALQRLTRKAKQASSLRAIPKLEDANEAGGKRSADCTLIITEGDSAKALAVAGLSVVGRDLYGVFPLRGKLLNVRGMDPKVAVRNEEVSSMVAILGLDFDKTYDSLAAARKDLRYGHVMIMADQDHDGSHIKGLVINLFHTFWPSLLQCEDFVEHFVTPIMKARRGSETRMFLSLAEFKAWQQTPEASAGDWKLKYYKGLGTNTAAEGKEYFSNLLTFRRTFSWSGSADGDEIVKAFGKDQAEARRKWLLAAEAAVAGGAAPSAVNATGNPLLPGTVSKTEAAAATSSTYSEFINRDLVEFSRADLYRSIPSGIDGLKPSQRKVLFAALKRGASEIKVAQLAGYCSEHTAYHHGEASLLATIVNLAQDFVGSNNVPLLLPVGQFGTRLMGGRDAASARYIYTKVNPLTRLLLPPDDDACLEYVEDDGQLVEPVHYVPILPLVLVNGAEGIGTGWSTYVPCFNPLEIVDVMVAKLGVAQQQTAGVQAELSPWYNGFRGTVSRSGTSWLTRGSCEMESEAVVRIRELPVGRWTDDFKASLVAMVEKGIVHSFREFHTVTDVDFLVKLTPDGQGAVVDVGPDALFKLKSSIPMSNMHLFDAHGKIKKYASAMEVIDDHMPVRLAVYQRRRARQLKELDSRVQLLENRARFISEVIDGRVKVAKQSKAELEQQLRLGRYAPMSTIRGDASADAGDAPARRHDFDYLLNAPLHSLTSDAVANAVKEIGAVRAERDTVDATREEEVWARELLAFKAAVQPSLVLAPHDRVASKTVRGRKKQQ